VSSRLAPSGLPGDPPSPTELGVGCPFQPRCPVRFEECATHPVQLWDAGADRRSACLRVLPEFSDRPSPANDAGEQQIDALDVSEARS
jgi:peptide/nickel transport system ATP-binding protein